MCAEDLVRIKSRRMSASGHQDLAAERREDLQDNAELVSTFIGDFPLKGRSGG
jgi:hypothetical protein